MVVLNKIYTRTGDDGTTALGTGERRKKYDLRVAAYGTLDELNAVIGIARLHTRDERAIHGALFRIQNDLFDLGADLTTPGKGRGPGGARLTVTAAQVAWLEKEIDRLNADKAEVVIGGNRYDVCTILTPDVKLGDWVLVHAGYSITQLDEEEARETYSLIQQIQAGPSQ